MHVFVFQMPRGSRDTMKCCTRCAVQISISYHAMKCSNIRSETLCHYAITIEMILMFYCRVWIILYLLFSVVHHNAFHFSAIETDFF